MSVGRDGFARAALAHIPHILTLLDRNPHSPTYGCFDRNYWHYRIIDFPSGMAQEFVWPLALAYDTPAEGNPYYRRPVVREWVRAGMDFAARSAHGDGSCDDYFPFERAAGAAAFSLLAGIEASALTRCADERLHRFFARRADWLARHRESGRLSNHAALIVLALELLGRRLGTDRWRRARDERLAELLSWQDSEGWFHEYGGFDPGYQTLTIGCLAEFYQLERDDRVREALLRATRVAAEFVHPDGTVGGEYGSRNTYNFFPHGFERVGVWEPRALAANDRFLQSLARGAGPAYEDDHLVGHHAWSYLLAWRHWVEERPSLAPRPAGRVVLPHAGVMVDRRGSTELYLGQGKGGVFKLFRDGGLVASDSGLSLVAGTGSRQRNAVSHLLPPERVQVGEDEIVVEGQFGWAKHQQMTPVKLVLLRAVMLSMGRLFPNLVRRALQRMLITGGEKAPYRYTRRLRREGDDGEEARWRVTDEIRGDWTRVHAAAIGAAQTSIYVVMSRVFQANQLVEDLDLTDRVRALNASEALRIERVL